MKNKKAVCYLVTMLILLLSSTLMTGCQLAQESSQVAKVTDELCGVLVTFGFQESLKASGDKIEGIVNEDGSSKFDGIEGYFMGLYPIFNTPGEAKSTGIVASKEFQTNHLSVNIKDDVEENNCETTLYVTTGTNDVAHLNPVYRRENGTYYTMTGQNAGIMLNGTETGISCSQMIDYSFTTNFDGETKTKKVSYKVNFVATDEAKQVFIKEMNQKDELIKTTEYLQNDLDQFIVDDKTTYVIVEEYMNNATKGNYIKRSIYSLYQKDSSAEEMHHTCYFSNGDKIIGLKTIQFAYK